ncbi:MAG: MFS transporter [Saprospiraceae bacterium]|nr:MFS transporter [Saprospiraceae bacterium]
MRPNERLLLIILACVNFTHIMDFMIMMPLGPQLMKLFQISPKQFGFAVSAYSLTAGVSGFVSAFFVDRFDRKKVLLFAYIGFVIGTFSCAFAPSYALLVSARILAGLFGGMIGAQVLSIVGDTFPYQRRAEAMGVVMTAFSLASVVGVPTGLWLAAQFSWHAPFLAVGGLGVLVTVFIIAFAPNMTSHIAQKELRRNPLHVLTDILHSPNQLRALALSATLMMGHFAIIPYIAPSLVGNVGYSQDNIFLIYLVGGLCTIFFSPWVGKMADRYGKYRIFVVFALCSVIPVWFITNLQPSPLWMVLAIAGMFFVFSNGRTIPMQTIVSGVVTPQQRGGFMSINSSLQQLSTGVAAYIGGAIIYKTADEHIHRYDWVGWWSIALILLSIWLAGRVKTVDQ